MQRFGRIVTFDVSYGAITPLYAGTAPDAGSLSGKVGATFCPEIHVYILTRHLSSISQRGHVSWLRTRKHSIPSWRRSCGSGVTSKLRTSRLLCECHALRGSPEHLDYVTELLLNEHLFDYLLYSSVILTSYIVYNGISMARRSFACDCTLCSKTQSNASSARVRNRARMSS